MAEGHVLRHARTCEGQAGRFNWLRLRWRFYQEGNVRDSMALGCQQAAGGLAASRRVPSWQLVTAAQSSRRLEERLLAHASSTFM